MARVYGNSGDGTTSGSNGGRLYVDYSYSQNIAGNYTDISWTVGFDYGNPNYWHNLSNGTLTFGASPGTISFGTYTWSASGFYFGTSIPSNPGGDNALASGSFRVAHSTSGTASITLTASTQCRTGAYTSSISTTFALPQIPRYPGAPTGLSVTGHADSDPTTATLSWVAPTEVGGGLTGRTVRVARDAAMTDLVYYSAWDTWATSVNLTGLPKGTQLYAVVGAQASGDLWGPMSSVYAFTTGTTIPGAPGLVSGGITNIGGTSADVAWTAPADTGGSPITSYQVQRATNVGFTTGVVTSTLPASPTTLQFTGLTRTTQYWVRVRAVNAVGNSSYSSVVSFTTLSSVPGAPATPSLGGVTSAGATVSWSAPSDNGGSTVTAYDVQIATNSGFTTGVSTYRQTGSPKVLTGLAPGTRYYVRVRAVNVNGEGTYSTAATFRTTTGLWVGNGSAWVDHNVYVGNGSTWVPCRVHVGTGSGWS